MKTLSEYKDLLMKSGVMKSHPGIDVEYFWCFPVRGNAEQVWSFMSDTERFNREINLTPREQKEIDGKMLVTTKMLGIPQQWIEEPWCWVANETLTYTRRYAKGMAKLMYGVYHIEQVRGRNTDEDKICNVYVYIGWQSRNLFWKQFLQLTATPVKAQFENFYKNVDAHLQKTQNSQNTEKSAYKYTPKALSEEESQRLNEAKQSLISKKLNREVVEKLCEHIRNADDLELDAIRVVRLAKKWGYNFKDVLSVCLHATKSGLLNISWNVVCPHCRGSRFSSGSLGDVPTDSSCDPCGITFTTDSAETIEIVFKVNAAVRKVPDVLYCAAEPAKKSHIKIQQYLEPKKEMHLHMPNRVGRFLGRIKGSNKIWQIQTDKTYQKREINLFQESDRLQLGLNSELKLSNDSASDMLFVLEEAFYDDTLLRPAQVLSFQEFRDLFAEEHLKSNVKLNLGEHTILFTDIVGSTKFYEKVGMLRLLRMSEPIFRKFSVKLKSMTALLLKPSAMQLWLHFPHWLMPTKHPKRFIKDLTAKEMIYLFGYAFRFIPAL